MTRRTERYACIHGHFYQPPRENPWLDAVEVEDSATPYHDWNERITAECYAANAAARLQTAEGRLTAIVRNYDHISFNFGPTLLAWLDRHDPETYREILEADRQSALRLGGHGNAVAQAYNHAILPLASPRDRATQVRWGIADFRRRFGRAPEGLWLPETAVDTPTLETLAEHGIAFTILSPRQAKEVAPLDLDEWTRVDEHALDATQAYRCDLPSGRSIAVFFYDGPVAHGIAFERLLDDGEAFAHRLAALVPSKGAAGPRLAHVATDGESYGHHHRFGDMALAYALRRLPDLGVHPINHGRFLEIAPPRLRVRIHERSSWSCFHGVERWRSDCGCHIGGGPGWNQAWRAVLRSALDALKERLDAVFETHGGRVLADPWAARDAYIEVVLDRSPATVDAFLARHARGPLDPAGRTAALRALEMQRHGLLMFTSCGWFFDDLAGLEAVQVLKYACRAARLAAELSGEDLEGPLVRALAGARCNDPAGWSGADLYERRVRPLATDLRRVAAHHAIAGALDANGAAERTVYAYTVRTIERSVAEHAGTRLGVGRCRVTSRHTEESEEVTVAVLHFGGHDFRCSVGPASDPAEFRALRDELLGVYDRGSLSDVVTALNRRFGEEGAFTLRDAFLEERRRILDRVVRETLDDLRAAHLRFYREHGRLLTYLVGSNYPLPDTMRLAAAFGLASEAERLVEALGTSEPAEPQAVATLVEEAARLANQARTWRLRAAEPRLRRALHDALLAQLRRLGDAPRPQTLVALHALLDLARDLGVEIDLWRVQSVAFRVLTEPTWASRLPPDAETRRAMSSEALRLADRLQFELGRVSRA
ncbi:MAG: DUF3536 domain-containing protein [Myxococcales bacterium]|nr:DUF3536 domain-containing protein [Myxococcales bacterium]